MCIRDRADTLSEKKSQYSFIVDKGANKIEIGKAVAKLYTVNVEAVNTMIIPCLLYTSPSPRDRTRSRMPSSA